VISPGASQRLWSQKKRRDLDLFSWEVQKSLSSQIAIKMNFPSSLFFVSAPFAYSPSRTAVPAPGRPLQSVVRGGRATHSLTPPCAALGRPVSRRGCRGSDGPASRSSSYTGAVTEGRATQSIATRPRAAPFLVPSERVGERAVSTYPCPAGSDASEDTYIKKKSGGS
jgi:hypothetical protein